MSQEEEFSKWLRRKEKPFEDNLKFAIKSWQSAEFTITRKYEIILEWLSKQKHLKDEQIEEKSFKEMLLLRAQPGLITQQVKRGFVDWFLELANEKSENTRKWCNLLHLLVEFELLQDLYRMDYLVQCRVYAVMFNSYEKYILSLKQSDQTFLSTFESEFFASVLKSLKDFVKRCGDIALFDKAYTTFVIQPMAQALIILRTFEINFFDEFLEIENLLCAEQDNTNIITRFLNVTLPVRLLCIECCIVKRRGMADFLNALFNHVFDNIMHDSSEDVNPPLTLTIAAFVIEMLGRHDVSLNTEIMENVSAVKFLGSQIYSAVKKRKDSCLKEVLMLLCAAMRLNPLILEENVFEISSWMILAPKSGNRQELELFEEYLVLLMDMFRRLSRPAKFVSNLLKALNENLPIINANTCKKRKSGVDFENQTPGKKRKVIDEGKINEETQEDISKYLNILFNDFFKPNLTKEQNNNKNLTVIASFPEIQNYWPSNPVGLSFSKFVTGLISKPSLTICKTLLFALKELIESLMDTTHIGESSLFQLDFYTALLCQYFAGCKLAEQADKFSVEIQKQREFTLEVLKIFGQLSLNKEHQPRIMGAFLELVYFASNFELILSYYRPDGCSDESLQTSGVAERLHTFLSFDQWKLLEQRALNFQRYSCKRLLHRVKLQKCQAALLAAKNEYNLKLTEPEIICSVLRTPQAKWYLQHLPRSDKMVVAGVIIAYSDFLDLAINDLDLLEFVSFFAYENICKALNVKCSLLKSLCFDFEKHRQCFEVTAYELLIKELIDAVISRSEKKFDVKNLSIENIKTNLDILARLPLGQLRRQRKTVIFALQLCLFRDLKAAQEDELAAESLEILKDLLHFGQTVLIFKYLPTPLLLKLLPADSCWEIYEFIFSTIKNDEKGTEQFLHDLANVLNERQSSPNLNDPECKLLMAAIETLTALTGPSAKHMRKHLNMFLKIFSEHLNNYFNNASDGKSKNDRKFVQKTLSAFAPYASYILAKNVLAKNKTEDSSDVKDFILEVDEDFRRIIKIYIGHSMDYRKPHSVLLMQVALNYRDLLHLDQDEIEFALTHYWSQINKDLNDSLEQEIASAKTLESAVKIIIGNKSNEDLLLILKDIANNIENTNFSSILKLLTLIAKCPFSTIKGAIFNEQYKQISINITIRLSRDEQQHLNNTDLIIKLLNCHQALIDNKMIPISTDTMDSILSFLMDINIKRFRLNDTNLNDFHRIHLAATEVCSSLIKYRHVLLMDRVPQYMHIFKDLLQAVVWYKSDRQKDTTLPSNEIDNLSEMALKLETLSHLFAQHKVGIKRVAPFVLTFIINLMVANKRPTTLYNKIKTHIENICYELVGICDHRVGRFILRCSNEAGRQLYEVLVKDYQKYHKFKGRV